MNTSLPVCHVENNEDLIGSIHFVVSDLISVISLPICDEVDFSNSRTVGDENENDAQRNQERQEVATFSTLAALAGGRSLAIR